MLDGIKDSEVSNSFQFNSKIYSVFKKKRLWLRWKKDDNKMIQNKKMIKYYCTHPAPVWWSMTVGCIQFLMAESCEFKPSSFIGDTGALLAVNGCSGSPSPYMGLEPTIYTPTQQTLPLGYQAHREFWSWSDAHELCPKYHKFLLWNRLLFSRKKLCSQIYSTHDVVNDLCYRNRSQD